MTTDVQTLTAQLAQAKATAEAAETELLRIATEKETRRQERENAWERDLVARHLDLDVQLEAQGGQDAEAFTQAITARDLPAAFAAWISQRSTREARRIIRNEAGNAEEHQHTGHRLLPDLRHYDADLLIRLQDEAEKAATRLGAETAETLMGTRPDEQD